MVSFNLHFMGIAAEDWHATHQFYAEKLGINSPDRNPAYGNWALMGRRHDAYRDTPAVLKFELVNFGKTPVGGWEWGITQGYRPGIFVDDLPREMKTLQDRGIEFSSDIVGDDESNSRRLRVCAGRWKKHRRFCVAMASQNRTSDACASNHLI
jgi:hypothetical protein